MAGWCVTICSANLILDHLRFSLNLFEAALAIRLFCLSSAVGRCSRCARISFKSRCAAIHSSVSLNSMILLDGCPLSSPSLSECARDSSHANNCRNRESNEPVCMASNAPRSMTGIACAISISSNVKGDASARGTPIQLRGFSPSHPPACSVLAVSSASEVSLQCARDRALRHGEHELLRLCHSCRGQ